MLHRNKLSRIIDNNVYLKMDKMYKFPPQYVQYWLDDRFDNIPEKSFIDLLLKKGMVIEREKPCKITKHAIIDNLHLQLTDRCMCKCEHCYVGEKGKSWLSLEECCCIIDNFISAGILSIDYTGGEPTLNPDFSSIIEYGKQQGLRQMLFTNGFIEEKLYDSINKNIDIIQISLDGDERYHNTFRHNSYVYQRAIESLKWFSKHNKLINISFSLSKDNIQYLEHVRNIAIKYGASLRVSPPVPVGENTTTSNQYYADVLSLLRKESKRIGLEVKELVKMKPQCSALKKTVYMGVDKRVYPCPLLNSIEYSIGVYDNKNLCKLLEGKKSVEMRKRINATLQSGKESVYFCPAFIFNLDINDENPFFGEK